MEAISERFNLAAYCIGRAAARAPDKTALLVFDNADASAAAERWTFRELDVAVRRVAAGLLAEGIRPGDRLMLRLPNTGDTPVVFFGAISAGIVPIPISSQLTDTEVSLLLADSRASGIVQVGAADGLPLPGDCRLLDGAAIVRLKASSPAPMHADTIAEAAAYMIYTSGTGARPKGVLHAHRVALGRAPMRREWEAIGADDVMLHAGAFNWSYTLGVGLLDPWSVGATAVLFNGERDIEAWPRLIRNCGATVFAAVPSLYRQMLKYCALAPSDFARVRHCLAAGEALSPAILSQWREATGTALYEALGMSECSTFISSGPGVPVKPGSPGKPQAGRRIAVLPAESGTEPVPSGTTGALAIHRSEPGLMLGYWMRPDEDAATTRGDWFVGGDLASIDADGYVWFHGRADDTMNAGGYRVSPAEVEAALADCPGIADVAVAEVSVRPGVTIVAAFVVRKEGSGIIEADVLHCAEHRLAAYKRPKKVVFLEVLPRSPNGKLLRRQLAATGG
ncbi:MAG: AMP-binding protein [Devosia sp.]